MGYTAPTTRSSGYLVTASNWNTDLVDNITFLANPPACRVYHSTTQSCVDSTATTVAFNSERFDTAGMHDTVTNNSRITIPAGGDGLYLLTFTGGFVTATDYVQVSGDFVLNGVTIIGLLSMVGTLTVSTLSPALVGSTVYKLAAGDFVTVRVYQDNTANAARNLVTLSNYSPEFTATWIGLG